MDETDKSQGYLHVIVYNIFPHPQAVMWKFNGKSQFFQLVGFRVIFTHFIHFSCFKSLDNYSQIAFCATNQSY